MEKNDLFLIVIGDAAVIGHAPGHVIGDAAVIGHAPGHDRAACSGHAFSYCEQLLHILEFLG